MNTNKDPSMGVLGYDRNELDFYQTPEWCTKAILPSLRDYINTNSIVWEPACGLGAMSEVLKQTWTVVSSDIVDRGYQDQKETTDFLKFKDTEEVSFHFNAIVTNPPYGDLLDPFIEKALELTRPQKGVVAFLMRNEVDSASSRSKIFSEHDAFVEKFVLTKRPRWIEYKKGDAAPRHNYSWFIWSWEKDADQYPIIRYGK
jgi:hypothetical protein